MRALSLLIIFNLAHFKNKKINFHAADSAKSLCSINFCKYSPAFLQFLDSDLMIFPGHQTLPKFHVLQCDNLSLLLASLFAVLCAYLPSLPERIILFFEILKINKWIGIKYFKQNSLNKLVVARKSYSWHFCGQILFRCCRRTEWKSTSS